MASRQFELACLEMTQRIGRHISTAALANARATCPVQTGELLRSLYSSYRDTKVTLGSPLAYSEHIENGRPEVNVSGTYVSKVKRHKRRTNRGRITVRAHTKTFQNMKPVLIGGESGEDQVWRTLSSSPGTEGTHFMRDALEKAAGDVNFQALEGDIISAFT